MKRTLFASAVCSLAIGAAASVVPAAQAARLDTAQFMVVQAVPGRTLDVEIDRRTLTEGSETGSVLGPFNVAAGEHHVTFTDSSGVVLLDTAVELKPGSRQDLVVHLPAQVSGDPVATLYQTPTSPIGVGKARVLIAHTASVAPADVRLDGKVVFTNIANGEFATADVATGSHVAELLPSGLTRRPILGPLSVNLPAKTATMVYAVGNARTDSMEVIAHSIPLSVNGADVPTAIDAGSAGLASRIRVKQFSRRDRSIAAQDQGQAPLGIYAAGLAGLLGLALAIAHRSRRRSALEASS